jgi:hypothetical protein
MAGGIGCDSNVGVGMGNGRAGFIICTCFWGGSAEPGPFGISLGGPSLGGGIVSAPLGTITVPVPRVVVEPQPQLEQLEQLLQVSQ